MRKNDEQRRCPGPRSVFSKPRQIGVYALEFAIVFPIFFLLFYGVLTFGLIFAAQQSLVLAAEDGARATLRYQMVAAGGADSAMASQLKERLKLACRIATDRVSWLSGLGAAPTCEAKVRGLCVDSDGKPGSGQCSAVLNAETFPMLFCGYAAGQQCLATLTMVYGYRANPLVPTVFGMGFVVPATLTGAATVTLDPVMLQRFGTGA